MGSHLYSLVLLTVQRGSILVRLSLLRHVLCCLAIDCQAEYSIQTEQAANIQPRASTHLALRWVSRDTVASDPGVNYKKQKTVVCFTATFEKMNMRMSGDLACGKFHDKTKPQEACQQGEIQYDFDIENKQHW